ncbi:MAG TPA: phosphatase PAP2 family protein [Steroidobacteraceae bacterium]|jgi:membrane-associated phospholipid phosphatase
MAPWAHDILSRIRWLFVAKAAGTTGFVVLFFVGYFYLQLNPSGPPTVMPLTPLDELIPLQPQWLMVYVSLFIYVGTGPGLQGSVRDLVEYAVSLTVLGLLGLLFFYLWPTQTPGVDANESRVFALLHQVDASGNACPSMHVAAAMFTAVRIQDVLSRVKVPWWLRSLNWAWCLAIIYSTLAVKQHVAVDAVAGALLGTSVALMSLAMAARPRPSPPVGPPSLSQRWH